MASGAVVGHLGPARCVADALRQPLDVARDLDDARAAGQFGQLHLHLVPCAQLREKTLELGTMIAKNRRPAVMGVKALLLEHMGCNLEEQWTNEQDYTRNVVRGAKADDAFPEFIARKGRTGG